MREEPEEELVLDASRETAADGVRDETAVSETDAVASSVEMGDEEEVIRAVRSEESVFVPLVETLALKSGEADEFNERLANELGDEEVRVESVGECVFDNSCVKEGVGVFPADLVYVEVASTDRVDTNDTEARAVGENV
jgi:hypothetical protein